MIDVADGLVGDNWLLPRDLPSDRRGPSPRRDDHGDERADDRPARPTPTRSARWAGDQLYVDLDLSHDNLPAGSRIAVGDDVVLEVTAKPHAGCAKFQARFGEDAVAFVNSEEGTRLRLRGLNAASCRAGWSARATSYAAWPELRPSAQRRFSKVTDRCGIVSRRERRVLPTAQEPGSEHEWGRAASHGPRRPGRPTATAPAPTQGRRCPFGLGQPRCCRRTVRRRPRPSGTRARGWRPPWWRPACVVGAAAGVGGAAVWTSSHDDVQSSSVARRSRVRRAPTARPRDGSVEKVAQDGAALGREDQRQPAPSGSGSGSGIILSADGKILTNNHVVAIAGNGGSSASSFNDGTHAAAKVLGTDPLTDTAVIQAQDVSGLTPATIGHSSSLQVGQGVVAIGSPFGLDATVTSGIVSALNRPVNVGTVSQGNATVYPAIQTDAAINPGNSGGPLVDLPARSSASTPPIQTATNGTGRAASPARSASASRSRSTRCCRSSSR